MINAIPSATQPILPLSVVLAPTYLTRGCTGRRPSEICNTGRLVCVPPPKKEARMDTRMDRRNRTLWIGLGIIALLLVGSSWGGGMMMGRGLVGPFGPFGVRPFAGPWVLGMWGIGELIRLMVVFGLIFLVVRLFTGSRRHYYDERHYADPEHLPADEILRRRYAAGEITREEYEEMRRTLSPVA